jgi:hypothetical protein
MAHRLFDRQASLLKYLGSAAALFGDEANGPVDTALQGIDPAVLRLQARFACNKRIEKIMAAYARTFEFLGAEQRLLLHEFVETSPATSKSTLENAREFHEFLRVRWECEPPKPAYLADVASCELAMTVVRNVVEHHERPTKEDKSIGLKQSVRRRRSVVPLRCDYDIRPIFNAASGAIVSHKRNTSVVVTLSAGSRDVSIVKVAPVVVEVLMLLDDWADPSALNAFGDREKLVGYLAAQGFIEVQG